MFRRNSNFILSVGLLQHCLYSVHVASNGRGWLMNYEQERIWKEVVLVELRHYFRSWLQGWGKPRKSSIRAAGFTAEIRSEYLSNTSLEPYRHTKQLGVPVCSDFYCLLGCDALCTGRSLPASLFYAKEGDSTFIWRTGEDMPDYTA
jgi:hypothetical protein